MKNLIKLIWKKSSTGWKFVYIISIPFLCLVMLSVTMQLSGVEPKQQVVKEVQKGKEQWELNRIQVAANHVNKYSPYTCNTYMIDESSVSPWDNHTVRLVCDNWNRFEVATVAGVVKVEFKG